MAINKLPVDLGAADPELKNPLIIFDIKDEREIIENEIPEERICYFNGESYPHGSYIKSGTIILLHDRENFLGTL